MPLNIAMSDRRLLTWAGVLLLPVIIAVAVLSPNEQESGIPSSYSVQSGGAEAAYLLLQEQGYEVQRWERSPAELPLQATGTVLVMALPVNRPSEAEKRDLQGYVSRGGHILITGFTAWLYIPAAKMEPEAQPAPEWKEYQPQTLSTITRGGAIYMSPTAYWNLPSTRYLVHYADKDRPIVVSYRVGKGEVIWWASSVPLTNAGISQPGNMELLLNSLGDDRRVKVLWDEYFHGSRRTLASYMKEPPIKFALLQGGIIFLALLFTYARRSGPVHEISEPSRLSPLEFIRTLGSLYRRARAVHSALEVPYARFRLLTTRRLGLRPDVSSTELARTIRERLAYKDDTLEELLGRIEKAMYDSELGERRALELVQELSRHIHNLKLVPQEQQENVSHADRVPGAVPRKN